MGWDNKHKIFIKFCKLCISAAIPDGICSPAPTACQWISRTIRLFVCLFICFCFVVLMCQTCSFLVLVHHQWKNKKPLVINSALHQYLTVRSHRTRRERQSGRKSFIFNESRRRAPARAARRVLDDESVEESWNQVNFMAMSYDCHNSNSN